MFREMAYARSDKEAYRRIRRLEARATAIAKGVLAKTSSSAPGPPSIKQATTPIPGGLQFQFTETGVTTGYRIYRSPNNSPNSAILLDYIQGSPSGADTFLYQDMAGSGTFYYWVAAVNPGGTQSDLIALQGASVPAVSDPTFSAKSANVVLAGPATGSDAIPTFRALVAADIPSLAYLTNETAVPDFDELTDAATIVWDFNNYKMRSGHVILTDNRNLQVDNVPNNGSGLLHIEQDATGNRTLTVSNSVVGNNGMGVLPTSTAGGAIDQAFFVKRGSTLYWSLIPNFT